MPRSTSTMPRGLAAVLAAASVAMAARVPEKARADPSKSFLIDRRGAGGPDGASDATPVSFAEALEAHAGPPRRRPRRRPQSRRRRRRPRRDDGGGTEEQGLTDTAGPAGNATAVVRVVVGSASRPKVEAARAGFAKLLPPGTELRVEGVEAKSGVAAQPVGLNETRRGALARLADARASDAGREADFFIAYEGGIEDDAAGNNKVCFAVVCVAHRGDDAFISEVRSATHSLPPGIVKLLDEGQELGHATDEFFKDSIEKGYGKSTGGTVGALTRGAVDRVEFYAHPTALALAPFVNADIYGLRKNPLSFVPAA